VLNCPNCHHEFSYMEVPFEDRKMKAIHAEYICPSCRLWLKPSWSQLTFIHVSLGLFLLSVICILLSSIGYVTIDSLFIAIGFFTSVAAYILNVKFQKAKLVKEIV
jgi:hypothetical protein